MQKTFPKNEKSSCDYPCDLRYLKRVGKSRSVVISRGCQKDLRLIHKSAEGLRVNYLISVALELGPVLANRVRMLASARVGGEESIL